MRTKHDITLANWRGHGRVTIPAGTRVSAPISEPQHSGSVPQCFVEDFGKLFPCGSMEYHDANYYGLRVNASDCEEG